MSQTTPKRHYLYTYPRTASNLLIRILSLESQPAILSNERGGYFFLPPNETRVHPFRHQGKPLDQWTQAERNVLLKSYETCFENLDNHVKRAEAEGKSVYIKEHINWLLDPTAEMDFSNQNTTGEKPWTVGPAPIRSVGNETLLSDDYLRIWTPTFLIRHPALLIPSSYRTSIDIRGAEMSKKWWKQLGLEMTLHGARALYDWYVNESAICKDSNGVWPIVLDADDVMISPELVRKYAELVGMDQSKLKFEWEPASQEKLKQMWKVEKRMRDTLDGSKGVVMGKTSEGLVIEHEVVKWKEEFGEEAGVQIDKWVRDSMGDYEYLKARRLQL